MESFHFTPATGARFRPRHGARVALVATVVLLLLLLLASTAQAYVPGQLIFAKTIGTSSSEAAAYDMAAGPNGTTVIVGERELAGGWAPMVAKYNNAGKRLWLKTYKDAGYGDAHAVTCDRSGNVYVAAAIEAGGTDIAVIKYSASGTRRWTKTYDGGAGGYDAPWAIAVDRSGDIVVMGRSNVTGKLGVVVLKFDPAGELAWPAARWDPSASDPDVGDHYAWDMVLDAAGDIYVGGCSVYLGLQNAFVVKLSGADGSRGPGWVYEPKGAAMSYFEKLVIRGSTLAGVGSIWDDGPVDENGLVVTLDRSLNQKAAKEWGVGNGTQEWFGDAVIDGGGNVYVTGDQWPNGAVTWDKCVTMKLNAKLGTAWTKRYQPSSKYAEGWEIARDGSGNIYVAGAAYRTEWDEDFLTIKYSPSGVRKWVKRWSGGPDDDGPEEMVIGTKGGVYVTGEASGRGDINRAVLLKYQR